MNQGIWKFVSICLLGLVISLPMSGLVQAADEHSAASHEAGATHDDAAAHSSEHDASLHHGAYSIWSDLPFWSAIAFIGFVIAIKALGLWDLLLNSMSEREKAEHEAIVLAEMNLKEARRTLRESQGRMEALDEKIRETMAEAARDAQSTRDEIISAAEREARGSVERAEHEINRVRDQSLNEIFETMANKVEEVAEQRLRSGLQSEDHGRLVGSVLADLEIR